MATLSRTWSPPSSPDISDQAVIATDNRGMITDALQSSSTLNVGGQATSRKTKRRSVQYVSRHFASPLIEGERDELRRGKRKRPEEDKENIASESDDVLLRKKSGSTADDAQPLKPEARRSGRKSRRVHPQQNTLGKDVDPDTKHTIPAVDAVDADHNKLSTSLAPWQQVLVAPVEKHRETFQRIFFGLNVDALSSDSDLTDVPSDLASEFELPPSVQPETRTKKKHNKKIGSESRPVVAIKEAEVTPKSKPRRKLGLTKSPYFPHAHKARPTFLSTLPFPPLDLERFGLMQERLCHDPFRLLLATIFLNKTPGQRAMPIFYKLMERYPTPERLAEAEQADITEIIRELGFQNQRARKCIAMAQRWVQDPPVKGRRWRKSDYPMKGDGKNVKGEEIIDDADERVAWEISHLPGLGPYSHDSWRMFCRDELRGLASKYNGEDASRQDGSDLFEPEWKRVLPTDKELRAWMTWMWMKEGWVWNKETGEKTKASDELMELARGKGNIVLESEANTLVVKSLDEDKPSPQRVMPSDKKDMKVDAPAGDYMP